MVAVAVAVVEDGVVVVVVVVGVYAGFVLVHQNHCWTRLDL